MESTTMPIIVSTKVKPLDKIKRRLELELWRELELELGFELKRTNIALSFNLNC